MKIDTTINLMMIMMITTLMMLIPYLFLHFKNIFEKIKKFYFFLYFKLIVSGDFTSF